MKSCIDLDGNPAGEVTDERRGVARGALKERFKKGAEHRKVREEAQFEARQEREARQRRREKRAQPTETR